MKKQFGALVVALPSVVALLFGCGDADPSAAGDPTDGGGSETWTGTLTGTGRPDQCPLGDDSAKGVFNENYTFTVTFAGNVAGNFAQISGSKTISGTGSYSGTESVARQSSYPAICTLQMTTATASITMEALWSDHQPIMYIRSTDALVHDRVNASEVPATVLILTAFTSVGASRMTGSWDTGAEAGNGNSASGSFVLQKTSQ